MPLKLLSLKLCHEDFGVSILLFYLNRFTLLGPSLFEVMSPNTFEVEAVHLNNGTVPKCQRKQPMVVALR